MNRRCALDQIVDHIKTDIIGVGRTSASSLPNKSNSILLPVGGKDGNNKSLQTKDNTLQWAKTIQKRVNQEYQSKYFGNLININNEISNGTIVDITIPSKLIDAYEKKYNNKLFQLTVDKKNESYSKINNLLKDYIKTNNIKVEFLDRILEDSNPVAVYDNINKVIQINQNKAGLDTLPEELAHHLTLALSNDNILVKRALNLINRVNYKEYLRQDYVNLYNNDSDLLKHEYLGKLISTQIVNNKLPNELNSESGIKIWDTIKNLLKAFINLFEPNSNIQSELDKIVNELSDIIVTGQKVGNSQDNIKLFQLNNKNKTISKDIRPQYVYYKGLLNKLKREDPDKNDEKILEIQATLTELLENDNKQALINLATKTLDEIEQYIQKLNKVIESDNKPNVDNIEKTIKTLHTFEGVIGISDRVKSLLNDIKKYAIQSVIDETQRLTNQKFTEEELINNVDKDIFIGEGNFGTLSDVKNYLGKTVGLLIKEAQSKVERKNKDSYNDLDKQIKALTKYQTSKGISKNNIYDIFIQEFKGTYTLTKPYKSEFYKIISDSFDKPNGKSIRNDIARYDSINKEWIPKDNKYINSNYTKIQSSKELKEFYNYFKNTTKEISDKLPIQRQLNEDFIPNIVEQSLLDILKSDKGLMSKMKDSVNHILEANDWGKDSTFIMDEELQKDEVPLKYLGNLPVDIKSKDLGTSLLKFMYFANSYEEMTEILPKTRLLQEIIKEQEFIKNTNNKVTISGENTNLNKMVEAFINMQVLQKNPHEQKFDPYIDFTLKYTSLLRIGLNPFNAITNVIIGNIGNLIESIGGRYFTVKQYLQATKIFTKENWGDDSKLNKLVEIFNPLMELEDYENLNKVSIGSKQYKEKIMSLMYSPQRIGEKQLQTSTMIALLLNTKLTDASGNKINMWDAFTEEGIWNEKLMGYKLEDDNIFQITNKIQRINQMIHGRYSSKDAAALTQYSLFRAAFQFKKWIPTALEARFGTKYFDDRLQQEVEGRYRTYVKGFNLLIGKLTNDIEKLESNKFTETDYYNMRKNYTEAILIFSTIMAGIGFDDDKKRKDPGYKFMMQQLNQISGDLLYFYNPKAMTETAAGGIPMLKTLKDFYKVIQYSPAIITGDKFKKGRYKGENKFSASLINITPIVYPIASIIRLNNRDPYVKK